MTASASVAAFSSSVSGSTNGWNPPTWRRSVNGSIRVVPRVNAFDAGKRQESASKAFPERQPATAQTLPASRVGCRLVGRRQTEVQGARVVLEDDEGRGGVRDCDDSPAEQRGHVAGAHASPCSSRSAINRNANACTVAVACFRVRPYAVAPGSAAMSASHRPSSSRKYSFASEKPVGDFGMNPSCHQLPGPLGLLSWITRYLKKSNCRASSAPHKRPKTENGSPTRDRSDRQPNGQNA